MSSTTNELPSRDQVPEELKWDYKAMYANDADWETDFRTVQAALPKLASFKGRLFESPETLLAALQARDEAALLLNKVSAYAHMRADEDTKNTVYRALNERAESLGTELRTAIAYMRSEILAGDQAQLRGFQQSCPGLALYDRQLELLERERPHTRSQEVSEVIAASGKSLGAAERIYGALVSSMKFPTIKDKDGKPVKVEDDNLNSRWLRSQDRGERKRGFHAVMGTYHDMRDVFAATYSAEIDANIFLARQHGWGSTLEASLGPKNIPTSVYTSLIDGVTANLPLLARYLELKKRLLGLKELRTYDLYVPVVKDAETHYDWQQTQNLILPALAPLGKEYVELFRSGYRNRWYDVVQTRNKRGGAWGGGGYYSSYPYSLLNHHGDLESVFTGAHEGGHCMHSLLSRGAQPFQYAQYVIFVAEVASTLNEALLEHYLLETASDRAVRITVLNKALEGVRQTMFRQALFAEFELHAHRLAEQGKPLTADVLCNLHRRLYRKYYGSVCVIDHAIGSEWMRIPHFYSSFYVYQYCIGMACARDLARQLLTEGEPARKRIIDNFLRAGGSQDPIDILRNAGTDPSTPHPVMSALKTFGAQLDQFEAELAAL